MRERYLDASSLDRQVEALTADLGGTRGRRALPGLDRAALVLLDLQRIFVDPESPAWLPAWPAVEPRALLLASRFRAAGRPVFLTRHVHPPGDAGGTIARFFGRLIEEEDPLSALAPAWEPRPGDTVLVKPRHSALASSSLVSHLEEHGVDVVVLAGVQAHLCVLATAVEAGSRDLVPVVALDAVAAPDVELHRASLRALSGGLGFIATVDEIVARLEG